MKTLTRDMVLLGVGELIKYLSAEDIDKDTINDCIKKYNAGICDSLFIYNSDEDKFCSIEMMDISTYDNPDASDLSSFYIEIDMISSKTSNMNFANFFIENKERFSKMIEMESFEAIKEMYYNDKYKEFAKTVLYKLYLADTIFDILRNFRYSYNNISYSDNYDDMLDTICYSTWLQELLNSKSLGVIDIGNQVLIVRPQVWIEYDNIMVLCTLTTCEKE